MAAKKRKTIEQPDQPVQIDFDNPHDVADVFAVQAWAAGTASPEQMQRSFRYVTVRACKTQDLPWVAGGIEAQRATDFASGRKFAGHQILKVLELRPNARPKTSGG